MPGFNEIKYSALQTLSGRSGGDLNGIEIAYLESLGHFEGTIDERWYAEFLNAGAPDGGSWNDNAAHFLAVSGITDGTLNERWMKYFKQIGIVGVTYLGIAVTHLAVPVTHFPLG